MSSTCRVAQACYTDMRQGIKFKEYIDYIIKILYCIIKFSFIEK